MRMSVRRKSHPVWVRGLKRQNCGRSVPRYTKVAPRVGAWIETTGHGGVRLGDEVAPRVGAWIETIMRLLEEVNTTKSHPVWVRGLKQDTENGE